MALWIPITIAAAFLQNIRSALQKHLKSVLDTTGVTFVRFGLGLPFAYLYWLLLNQAFDLSVPSLNLQFWLWTCLASFSQIGGTFLLVHLFSYRNFAVGSAYSRTEAAQTALFAAVVVGETVTLGAVTAIIISIIGLMIISVARSPVTYMTIFTSVFRPVALIGLASGLFFGISSVSYRAAMQTMEDTSFLMQASTTLCVTITLQTFVMLIWIILRDPSELKKIAKAWMPAVAVGFFGATASLGWFIAFSLQSAALVKVLAQVEMIFTFFFSVFIFRESINRSEIVGCILISAGIIVLVLS